MAVWEKRELSVWYFVEQPLSSSFGVFKLFIHCFVHLYMVGPIKMWKKRV